MDPLFLQLSSILESALAGISAEQFRWRPPNKWCAAEILEHLYLSYTGTSKGLERMLQAGRPSAAPATIGQRSRALFVLTFNYLPSGRQAPAPTRPKGLPPEQVRNGYAEKIAALDEMIVLCESRFGRDTPLLDHPFLGPLNGAQWRKFHLLHGRHHQKQILRLRSQLSC
jgi:hypothetical protein